MSETKAVARLPNLDIEILHRKLPEQGAEMMSISLRATPSFRAMADFLDLNAPMLGWLAFSPWMQLAQSFWQPWLAALPAPRIRDEGEA
jgi:hypothetical protein